MLNADTRSFGLIAIGRNEGNRLKRCLQCATAAALTVYVDSGSRDGSVEWARAAGVDVVELDRAIPFTAARARNQGFKRLRKLKPDIGYVQFVDGDCELDQEWPSRALRFLEDHGDCCAVFGRRRERYPDRSIYNRLCDAEWDVPVGETRAFGGDVMVRIDALEQVHGYRDQLIAGEEPELSLRLRRLGWRIWRLDHEMSKHDANITRFSQWWQRTVRSGYAFAQGAALHGGPPEYHWVWESCRAWLWAVFLPIVILTSATLFGPSALLLLMVYPAQVMKQMLRARGTSGHRMVVGVLQVLARFPEAWGQILFLRDRLAARQIKIIEYK